MNLSHQMSNLKTQKSELRAHIWCAKAMRHIAKAKLAFHEARGSYMPNGLHCPLSVALQAYVAAYEHGRSSYKNVSVERKAMLQIALESTKVAQRHLEGLIAEQTALDAQPQSSSSIHTAG